MSLVNLLRARVAIQLRVATQTATGETVVWTPVETRWARVVALDVGARAVYQQLRTEATHKVIFRGRVSLSLGNYRLLWGSKTLVPIESAQESKEFTTVVVREA